MLHRAPVMGALILNKRFVRRCRQRNSGLVVEKR
jgi:hypothetical protein